MKLNTLSIKNFKGIESLDIDLDGQSASIYGQNATGKTSIYDAFLWLLFGKDSRGSATFSIKPIRDGEPVHNIETSVEATISCDDGDMTLRRVYREVWTRRRGDSSDTFSGHETLYFVDGLPATQSNYKKTVDGIMPESLFRSLTNPFFFPESLKWQERRTQLFKLFGNLTDADVAAQNDEYLDLLEKAGRHTVEEFQSGLKAKVRTYNQQLKEIPARIDEVNRQILDDDDELAAEGRVDTLSAEIRDLKTALESDDDQELIQQRQECEAEILQLQHRNDAFRNQARIENAEKNRRAMNDVTAQIEALQIPSLDADVRVMERECEDIDKRLVDLRAKFTAVASEPFTAQDVCPTCGRPFPKEDIESARAAFEAHRTARLDEINAEGRELSKKLKDAKQRHSDASDELAKKKTIRAEYEEALASLRTEELAPDMDGFVEAMQSLTQKRTAILEAIQASRASAAERNASILATMGEKQAEYATAKQYLSACTASQNARKRVEELWNEQVAVSEALEDAEAYIALCDEFIRKRVSMVEESINRHFDMVVWQLYREQINGGLEEICEATVDGVPYHDLNGASRINAGIDIIHACSNVTGQTAPIFVDNAESVTDLLMPKDTQIIRLVVSESDTQLRLQK